VKACFAIMAAAPSLWFAASAAMSAEPPDVVDYGCRDLVVIGRVQTLDYQHFEIEGDFLGHGWATAKVRVDRVLHGQGAGPVLDAGYYTHAYLRDDLDFLLVLKPSPAGPYEIVGQRVRDGHHRWRLAPMCRTED
jgi:hypothetical protein